MKDNFLIFVIGICIAIAPFFAIEGNTAMVLNLWCTAALCLTIGCITHEK